MSVRFDVPADNLSRTTNLPASNAFTFGAWVRMAFLNTLEMEVFEMQDNTGAVFLGLFADASQQALHVGNSAGGDSARISMVLGKWYYFAVSDDGANMVMTCFEQDGTATVVTTATSGTLALTSLNIGGDPGGVDSSSFDIYKPRIWGAVLSLSDLVTESKSKSPVRTSGLNSSFDFETTSDILTDTSGNGRNLTNPGSAGTWTNQSSPLLGTVVALQTGSLGLHAGYPQVSGGTQATTPVFGAFDYKLREVTWFDEWLVKQGIWDHDIVPSGVATVYTLNAASGSIPITGTSANLLEQRKLLAASGSIPITGTSANLLEQRKLLAASGSIPITGTSANLLEQRKLLAASGSIPITGTPATLTKGIALIAGAGAVPITGTATLLTARKLQAGAGAVALTGTPASLRVAYRVLAGAGSVPITGTDASFTIGRSGIAMDAAPGSTPLTGTDASLLWNRALLAASGNIPVHGQFGVSFSAAFGTQPSQAVNSDDRSKTNSDDRSQTNASSGRSYV